MHSRSLEARATHEDKRRWVVVPLFAFALTVSTVARVFTGPVGALIVAGTVLALAGTGWALLGHIDDRRRRRECADRAHS